MQVEKHETGKEIYRVNVHVACLMGGSSELLHWESLFNWLCVSHGEREKREETLNGCISRVAQTMENTHALVVDR